MTDSSNLADLPLLTDIIEDEGVNTLPVLTELVAVENLSSLPILTDVVDEGNSDTLPVLTEVIATTKTARTSEKLTPKERRPAPAPAPARAYDEAVDSSIQTGSHIAPAEAIGAPLVGAEPAPPALNEFEIQQLLSRVDSHLTTMFAEKLSYHLEALQRQAVTQAMDELKTELPNLLRDALNTPSDTEER